MTSTETGRRAHALFSGAQEAGYPKFYDYDPIIHSLGSVIVKVEDDDYSGDTRVLLKSGDRYGFVVIGWGSCSGCDALQACSTFAEVDELIAEIESGIVWFDSLAAAQAYIGDADARRGNAYFHRPEWDTFVRLVAAAST